MTQRWRGPLVAVCTALLLVAIAADFSFSRPARPEGRRELHRQEQQVKRARRVTRRIVHDRRASEGVKQQAQELDQLLSERERTIQTLTDLHTEFMTQHQADIDELTAMRRRAMEIDRRLREARKRTLEAHAAEVQALVVTSKRAEELINALTAAYSDDKRQRRSAPVQPDAR